MSILRFDAIFMFMFVWCFDEVFFPMKRDLKLFKFMICEKPYYFPRDSCISIFRAQTIAFLVQELRFLKIACRFVRVCECV